MKSCELCKSPAKIYCDSDQASLCWTCDSKVHSANFLVARHPRILLCRVCQSQTPWTATGDKLGPSAVSVCDKCLVGGISNNNDNNNNNDNDNDNNDDNDSNDDDEYDGDEDGETELDVEDEDDNQVVPLAYDPPPVSSSSSSGDSYGEIGGLMKRKRVDEVDASEDDVECLSERKNHRVACRADSSEVIEGNNVTLYNFISLSSERMGEKPRNKIYDENKSGAVTSECKTTRTVGLDLNSNSSDS